MADYLLYWKYYWRDVHILGPGMVTSDWHTSNERIFDQLRTGDNLWVVIQGGDSGQDEWRLLERICIGKLEQDVDEERYEVNEYGRFHVIGDPTRSDVFDPVDQPDFTPLLLKLTFSTGRKITSSGRLIGQSLQTARKLSDADTDMLKAYSAKLILM